MNALRITYLGQCGFLIECVGARTTTRIVTDPYLSDSVDQLYFSEETPWKRRYAPAVTLAELHPDGVLISHAHGDHLDPQTIAPYVAAGGNAVFVAPAPETEALLGLGVSKVADGRAEQSFQIGSALVTPVACAHTQLHMDAQGRFHELSYLIEFAGYTLFFGGDMSLYDGLIHRLARAKCRLLLLPCNGHDAERTRRGIVGNIDAREAATLCRALHADAFIPMHHDLYEINGCDIAEIMDEAEQADVCCLALNPMESRTIEF